MKEIKKRLQSKVTWIAIISQILLIVALYMPELTDSIKIVATALVEIATVIGVLNNPADGVNW